MRATNVPARLAAKKKVLKRVAGFRGRLKNYTIALQIVRRAEQQSYVGRKLKKREYRRLWIARINIACRALGMPYNRFIQGLTKASVIIDRKQLSEMAIHQPAAFQALVEKARAALV